MRKKAYLFIIWRTSFRLPYKIRWKFNNYYVDLLKQIEFLLILAASPYHLKQTTFQSM